MDTIDSHFHESYKTDKQEMEYYDTVETLFLKKFNEIYNSNLTRDDILYDIPVAVQTSIFASLEIISIDKIAFDAGAIVINCCDGCENHYIDENILSMHKAKIQLQELANVVKFDIDDTCSRCMYIREKCTHSDKYDSEFQKIIDILKNSYGNRVIHHN